MMSTEEAIRRLTDIGRMIAAQGKTSEESGKNFIALEMELKKAEEENMDLKLQVAELRGTVKGLKFSVRCNGVCGNEVV